MNDALALPALPARPRPEDIETRPIVDWLEQTVSLPSVADLPALGKHLATLGRIECSAALRLTLLDRLFARGMRLIKLHRPLIVEQTLPLPKKTRQLIRGMQDLLRSFAQAYLNLPIETASREEFAMRAHVLWQALSILGQHIRLSYLSAAPVGVGIWHQLHQSFAIALGLGLAGHVPPDSSLRLQDRYFVSLLLSCALPATFSAREVDFIADYLETVSGLVEYPLLSETNSPDKFWFNPELDSPAVAAVRRYPPPGTLVHFFRCQKLAHCLGEQLASLESGCSPGEIGVPGFLGTPGGHGVLKRLIKNLGVPEKRRFPRRRQNNPTVLCAGFENVWSLLSQESGLAREETPGWIVINESPDGLAVMHSSGKPGHAVIGDIVAVRNEQNHDWAICIVRWAMSANPEHLEIGLQILATNAAPALVLMPQNDGTPPLQALVLREIPWLYSKEALIAPAGALSHPSNDLILVVEKGNLCIREVNSTDLLEQNGRIEMASIETVE